MLYTSLNDEVIEHIYNSKSAYWIATLNDNTTVYQCDKHGCSWSLLKQHCNEKRLRIVNLTLAYFDNVVRPLLENASGYFFAKGIGKFWGDEETEQLTTIGYLKDNKLHCWQYKVPSLQLLANDVREITDKNQKNII